LRAWAGQDDIVTIVTPTGGEDIELTTSAGASADDWPRRFPDVDQRFDRTFDLIL
jgi:hypothetical protein